MSTWLADISSRAHGVATYIFYIAIAGAPLPFGSRDPAVVAFWCVLLGLGLLLASPRNLRRPHYWLLAGVAVIVAGYAVVLHEQLAEHPWAAPFHPVWAEAAALLKMPVQPSVSIVRGEPLFALGAPLANVLALVLGLLVGADRNDARRALKVFGWAGVGYAAYGIFALVLDPHEILWREKTSYIGNLTATFINRNTAATYFGSCTIVWFLLLSEQARGRLPQGRIDWPKLLREFTAGDRNERDQLLVRFSMLFVCLTALFLTVSRAGALFSLFMLGLAFLVFFHRRLPRGKSLMILLGGMALVVLSLLYVVGGSVSTRFEIQGLSDEGRVAIWRSTLRIISDYPWFGTGLGTFAWAVPPYRSSEISMWGVWDAAHSTPLELASEVGLPLALTIGLGWLVVLGRLGWASFVRRRDRVIPLAALCVALLALLHSSIDFSLQVAGFSIVAFGLTGIGLAQAARSPRAAAQPNLPDEPVMLMSDRAARVDEAEGAPGSAATA